MAEPLISHAHPLVHPSIYLKRDNCDYSLTMRSGRKNCGVQNCAGNMYHCALYPPNKCTKEIPSQVRGNFKSVHWENRIHEFQSNEYVNLCITIKFVHIVVLSSSTSMIVITDIYCVP